MAAIDHDAVAGYVGAGIGSEQQQRAVEVLLPACVRKLAGFHSSYVPVSPNA